MSSNDDRFYFFFRHSLHPRLEQEPRGLLHIAWHGQKAVPYNWTHSTNPYRMKRKTKDLPPLQPAAQNSAPSAWQREPRNLHYQPRRWWGIDRTDPGHLRRAGEELRWRFDAVQPTDHLRSRIGCRSHTQYAMAWTYQWWSHRMLTSRFQAKPVF